MIIYDTVALVAGERNKRHLWALHDAALRRGIAPIVRAGVLAQRGAAAAGTAVAVAPGCVSAPLDEPLARGAGSLCATANTSDVVDASVVVIAQSRHAKIMTSDEPDIRHLASSAGASLTIRKDLQPGFP